MIFLITYITGLSKYGLRLLIVIILLCTSILIIGHIRNRKYRIMDFRKEFRQIMKKKKPIKTYYPPADSTLLGHAGKREIRVLDNAKQYLCVVRQGAARQ